jgi:anti-sigma B factor antagonist
VRAARARVERLSAFNASRVCRPSKPGNKDAVSTLRFTVERNEEGETLRLALYGELDLYGAPRLDDELVRAEGEKWPEIVIDLCRLEFMDSSGLRLILRTHTRAKQEGRRVRVVHAGGTIGRILRITRVDRELEVAEHEPAVF